MEFVENLKALSYACVFNICSHNQILWLKMTNRVSSCCDSHAN